MFNNNYGFISCRFWDIQCWKCCDLEIWVWVHSRPLKEVPYHSLLFAVKDTASSQDSPPFSRSLMTTCCQMTRGRPRSLLSSGTQCSTCFAILSSLILYTCPNHLNRRSWTDSSNFSWPVCFAPEYFRHEPYLYMRRLESFSATCGVQLLVVESVLVKDQVSAP